MLFAHVAADKRVVGFDDAEARVSQAMGEITVIGENDETGGIEIESPDGIQPRCGGMLNQIKHGASIHPGFVGGGGKGLLRLIEHDVHQSLGLGESPTVDSNFVVVRIDEDGQLTDDLSVHLNVAVEDHSFAHASRGDSRIGHDTLKTLQAGSVFRRVRAGHNQRVAGSHARDPPEMIRARTKRRKGSITGRTREEACLKPHTNRR